MTLKGIQDGVQDIEDGGDVILNGCIKRGCMGYDSGGNDGTDVCKLAMAAGVDKADEEGN